MTTAATVAAMSVATQRDWEGLPGRSALGSITAAAGTITR